MQTLVPKNIFNSKRLGKKFNEYLREIREESLLVIGSFLSLAYVVLKGKGQVSYEWPAYAVGWKLPNLDESYKANGLNDVVFHGCALGLVDNGKPVQKPWRIKTTSASLVESLSHYRCQCPPGAHTPCQGKITPASEN